MLDLALGTGNSAKTCAALFSQPEVIGIDVSARMLEIARKKGIPKTIQADARDAGRYIEPGTVDVVLMHFLFAYVPPKEILPVAARLLRQGALLSIATSTFDSFRQLQKLGQQSGLLSEKMQRSGAQVPASDQELGQELREAGLEIVDRTSLARPVQFETFHALYEFGLSGWFAQYWAHLTPADCSRIAEMPGLFPVEDEWRTEVVLCRRR